MGKISLLVILAAAALAGCGGGDVETNVVNRPPSTPVRAPGLRVERPVYVNFSTYAKKDWPVEWEWQDPANGNKPKTYDLKNGTLRVRVPTGREMTGETHTSPRYLKSLTGNFEIETRLKFLPKENYQGAGLLIYSDDRNFLRFERSYGGAGGGGEGMRFDRQRGDEFVSLLPAPIAASSAETDLKIVRRGTTFTAFWRPADSGEWQTAGTATVDYPETILAGLVACNTAEEIYAEFEYIRLQPVR